jgi:hypothetical protein
LQTVYKRLVFTNQILDAGQEIGYACCNFFLTFKVFKVGGFGWNSYGIVAWYCYCSIKIYGIFP